MNIYNIDTSVRKLHIVTGLVKFYFNSERVIFYVILTKRRLGKMFFYIHNTYGHYNKPNKIRKKNTMKATFQRQGKAKLLNS